MRLFIAVNLSDEIKGKIIKIQDQLRSQCIRGTFSRPENLHLTLAFIGETSEDKLEMLYRIIGKTKTPPLEIVFSRSGCFTHSHKELWWIGANKGTPGVSRLEDIHTQLINDLSEAGFPVDRRPFNVHITLAREIRHNLPITLDCPEIKIRADHISLMKSENICRVLTYTEIFKNDLQTVTNVK